MKKFSTLILALSSLFIFSCGEGINETPENEKSGTLVFSSEIARTALPDVTESVFQKITLTGVFNGETHELGTWNSLSTFKAATVTGVRIGSWSLTLKAESTTDGTGAVYSDTKNVNVVAGTNPVSFNIAQTSWGTGSGNIIANLTTSDTVKKATFILTTKNSTTPIETKDVTPGTPTGGKVTISYSKNSLSATNQYELSVKFYGEANQFLNEVTEVFTVGTGLTSTWTKEFTDLNSIYSITYNLDSGTISGNYDQYYTVNSGTITLPRPTKAGFTFEGWFTDASCTGTKITTIPAGSTGNKTFWAKWEEVTVSSYLPEKNATSVYEDETISITFDTTPTLGTGNITISAGSNTQTISVDGATTNTQSDGTNTRTINVKKFNIQVVGTQVVIIPAAPLENNKQYTITIPNGAINGKINGANFTGISDWSFTTRAKHTPSSQSNITVDCNVENTSADFRTVSGAMRAVTGDATIKVAPGTYRENIYFKKSYNLKIEGTGTAQYGSDVILQGINCVTWNNGTDTRPSFWFGGKNLTLKNVTLQNAYTRSMESTGNNQAEAIYFNSSGKLVAYNSSFKSYQDTILTKGKNWFYKCYVEGDVDFMWGYADVALFEECSIKTLGTSAGGSSAAYLFETRVGNTSADTVGKGYVLFNSTVQTGTTTYFARRATAKTNPTNYYDQVAIIDTTFTANGGSVNSNLWYIGNEPEYIAEGSEIPVGWKVYGGSGYTAKTGTGYGTISKATHDKEYNGRNVILNSVYNKKSETYERAAEIWDVTSLATEFNATLDTSTLPTATSETYIWDFASMANSAVNIQGNNKSGEVSPNGGTGTNSSIKLSVTTSSSGGKLETNGSNSAQFNSGTTISFPVDAGDKVEVVAYDYNNCYQNITINGTAMTALTDSKTFTAAGTCEIASTADNTYIVSITLTKDLTSGGTSDPTPTDFFETFASPGTTWGNDWVAKGTSKDNTETITFSTGVKVVCGGDTKFADKTDSTWSDSAACVQFGKASNNNSIIVPVEGNCTISVYFDSNKIPATGEKDNAPDVRSLLATASAGTVSVGGGTASTSAFYDCSASTVRVKETVVFTYTGSSGNVTITCNKSATESAGGACYIYGLKVAYTGSGTSAPEKTLSSISIATQPTKTSYTVGDTLNLSGLVVKATYSDSSTKNVTGYTCSPANGTSLSTVGTQTVNVSYTESGVTKTTSFTVSVAAASSGNTISKNDTPLGFAGVNYTLPTFTSSNTVTVKTRAELKKAISDKKSLIYISGMIDMTDEGTGSKLPTEGGSNIAVPAAMDTWLHNKNASYSKYSTGDYENPGWVESYAKECSETTNDKEEVSSADEAKKGKNSTLYSTVKSLNDSYKSLIQIIVPSNTTIIGADVNSGIRGGTFSISGVNNVVIRNVIIKDAIDMFPHHEKNDGYNAQFDGITIQGDCSNIWIDHCTFIDTLSSSMEHVWTGWESNSNKGKNEKWQNYDGDCDMKGYGKGITVSYCVFQKHDKTMLIGNDDDPSKDKGASNETRKISIIGNHFDT